MKPQHKINLKWSRDFAYALGLIVTDGCLYNDGRHLSLTSNDIEQLENFKKCLGITANISYKKSGYTGKNSPHLQFGDVRFYRFLLTIGITPHKTKTIGRIDIPSKYFFDFLRGHHDGDGCFYSYWDPRWRSSYMFYLTFLSASKRHIIWLRSSIVSLVGVRGALNISRNVYQLRYAKKESLQLLKKMYYSKDVMCLTRKRDKIAASLRESGIVYDTPRWRNWQHAPA